MTANTTPRLIAADDDLAEAWLIAATRFQNADGDWCHTDKITVCVTRNAGSDVPQEFHFSLYPDQAVELAHRLLELAEKSR